MYRKLPEDSRGLVWKPYDNHPMTLNVIALEVSGNTKLGDKLLKEMGFTDG